MSKKSQSEDVSFAEIKEDIYKMASIVVENSLNKKIYNSKEVQDWVNLVSDNTIKALTEFNRNFKYVVTCIIMQKNEAELNVASTCFWNSQIDGYCTIKWENPTMFCIVNVFAVGL